MRNLVQGIVPETNQKNHQIAALMVYNESLILVKNFWQLIHIEVLIELIDCNFIQTLGHAFSLKDFN